MRICVTEVQCFDDFDEISLCNEKNMIDSVTIDTFNTKHLRKRTKSYSIIWLQRIISSLHSI